MRIKTGDTVVVISGKCSYENDAKGKIKEKKERVVNDKTVEVASVGKVLKTFPKENKVIVEGVNKVKKHVKPNQANAEGQIVEVEAPIHVSNVMILDPKDKKPTRVGYKEVNGKKVRYAKKSGTVLDK